MTTITRHLGNGDEANQETVLPFCSTGEHSGTDSRTLALTLLPFCSKGERLEAQSLLSEQSALDASTVLEHGGIKLDVGGDVADGLGGREFVGLLRGRSGELVAGSSLATAGSVRQAVRHTEPTRRHEENTTRGGTVFYCPQKKTGASVCGRIKTETTQRSLGSNAMTLLRVPPT
jgi:hypothetical protein